MAARTGANEQPASKTALERASGAEWVFFVVDELQKSEDFKLIDQLRDENRRLKETLGRFQRHWKILLHLLREAVDTALHLEYECDHYLQEETV